MMVKKLAWLYLAAMVLWTQPVAIGENITCTITVVDLQAAAALDAEVIAYERKLDVLIGEEQCRILCQSQKTNTKGIVTLNLESKHPGRVMLVARKDGYAMGWDVLPYRETASPNINLVLDTPLMLAGRVVDAQGQPVANASVQTRPKNGKLQRLEQNPVIGPAEWMTTQTDKEGYFRWNGFGADVNSDFLVTAPGSKTTHKFTPHYLSSCGYETGRDDICLTLPKQTAIRGRLVDNNENPIAGATVLISPDHSDRDYRMDYTPFCSVTDNDGRYVLNDVPLGGHFIKAINTGLSKPWVDKMIRVDIADSPTCDAEVIRVETGGLMQVQMQDASAQKPIENMFLIFSQPPADPNKLWFRRDVVTDAEGKAKVILPTGQCKFRFWDDRYERTELQLPVVDKGKSTEVCFKVSPNKPLAGVVQNPDGTPAADVSVKMTWGQNGRTGADGTFKCVYQEMREGMCLIARDTERNRAAVLPIGDPYKTATLTLQPARTLKGTVVDQDGAPISAARIEMSFSGPGYLSECCPERLTDQAGRFEVKAIPSNLPDGYAFRISTTTMNHGAFTYKRLQILNETDDAIELKPVIMSSANLSLDGYVLNNDGTPAAGLPIFLQGDGQYHLSAVTDKDGRFSYKRLCKGEIRLQAGIGGEDFKPGCVTAQSGDTNVKILMGQDRVHVPQTSLAQKSLPAWDKFDFAASTPSVQDKTVLVCFWDFTQRPSRHVIGQLDAMKQTLAQKNIDVLLIHTAPMDDKARSWLAEKQLPFHAGSITNDADSIQSEWGVQSLPWLILTNPEHNVIAEGFSVDELENKLNGV